MLKANIAKWLTELIIEDLKNQKPEHDFVERANKYCIEHLTTSHGYFKALSIKKNEVSYKLLKRKFGELKDFLIKKLF